MQELEGLVAINNDRNISLFKPGMLQADALSELCI